jgi:signal peptidase II
MQPLCAQTIRSPAAILRFAGVCAAGLAVDLLTKVWAFRTLLISMTTTPEGRVHVASDTYRLIPGWLHFDVTVNQGAVFGVGQGQRWLFVAVSVLAVLFLSYLFAVSRKNQWAYQMLLGLLLAGVLGNMYDRVVFGYVRDMIHALPRWPKLFPWIFNAADSMLCVGVFLMVVYSIIHRPEAQPALETQLKVDQRG